MTSRRASSRDRFDVDRTRFRFGESADQDDRAGRRARAGESDDRERRANARDVRDERKSMRATVEDSERGSRGEWRQGERRGREDDDQWRERARAREFGDGDGRFGRERRAFGSRASEQREVLASKWLEQNAHHPLAGNRGNSEKMKREIYVGNLVSGQIGATTMCDMFNEVLRKMAPEACHAIGVNVPPVLSIVMDAAQKFAFVEMRSAKLANAALGLDQIHVMGRPLKIGRPAGYFEDPDEVREVLDLAYVLPAPEKVESVYKALDARRDAEALAKAEAVERARRISESVAHAVPPPTMTPPPLPSTPHSSVRRADAGEHAPSEYVCLENMVDAKILQSARERKELRYDVEDECAQFSSSIRVVVPTPTDRDIAHGAPSKAYVRFDRVDAARAAYELMRGRAFAGRVVSARFVTASEFDAVDRRL